MAANQSFNMQAAALTQIWAFPKLKGQENYQPWAKKMRSALKYSGLWQIVESGRKLFPNDLSVEPPPTEEQVTAYQKSITSWKDLNNQAAELIYSMCEEKPAEAIEDVDLAMSRWNKLEEDYTDSGFVSKFTKLEELWSTSLGNSGNSMETYIANIRTKSKDLKRMGAPIDEWILVTLLLNNLDSNFKDFVHRLVTQLDDLPDFDKIVTLLHEEDRLLKRDHKKQEDKKTRSNESSRGGRNSGRGRGSNNKQL